MKTEKEIKQRIVDLNLVQMDKLKEFPLDRDVLSRIDAGIKTLEWVLE